MELVEICFPEAALFNLKKAGALKLFKIRADASFCGPHIVREFDLTWKARVVAPCVFQKHGVCKLRTDRKFLFCQNEIRHLGKTVSRNRICSYQFNIPFLEVIANVSCWA